MSIGAVSPGLQAHHLGDIDPSSTEYPAAFSAVFQHERGIEEFFCDVGNRSFKDFVGATAAAGACILLQKCGGRSIPLNCAAAVGSAAADYFWAQPPQGRSVAQAAIAGLFPVVALFHAPATATNLLTRNLATRSFGAAFAATTVLEALPKHGAPNASLQV